MADGTRTRVKAFTALHLNHSVTATKIPQKLLLRIELVRKEKLEDSQQINPQELADMMMEDTRRNRRIGLRKIA